RRGFWSSDGVVLEHLLVMVAPDESTGAGCLVCRSGAIVHDAIAFEDVAMGAHRLALLSKDHSNLAIAADGIAPEEVVGVLMTDRQAILLIAANVIVLEQAMLDAPAHVQPIPAILEGAVAAHDRMLRPAARVQAQPGVVFAQAVCHGYVVGHLDADTVAVIVSDDAVAQGDVLAFKK